VFFLVGASFVATAAEAELASRLRRPVDNLESIRRIDRRYYIITNYNERI